jgi:hypothetical protein
VERTLLPAVFDFAFDFVPSAFDFQLPPSEPQDSYQGMPSEPALSKAEGHTADPALSNAASAAAPQTISRLLPAKNVILSTTGTPVFEDTVYLRRIARTLSICLLFAISAKAQSQGTRLPAPGGPPTRGDAMPSSDPDDAQQRQARELAKKANLQRQVALKADTDKLLKLAVELKNFVDKSNENVLSLEVLKKAEEIEKLAHSVKDKMKGPA